MKNQKIPKLYYTNEHQTFLIKARPGDINATYTNAFHMAILAIKNNILPGHWHYIHTCGAKGVGHLINAHVTPAPLINLSITPSSFDNARDAIIELINILETILEENRQGITSSPHPEFIAASSTYEVVCKETYAIARSLLIMTDYYKETGEIL